MLKAIITGPDGGPSTLAGAEVWLVTGTTMCGWCWRIRATRGPR
jgi:hypothetical protein